MESGNLDIQITPYNLDTNELALFSVEECNIACEYCHYKFFKEKFMGNTKLDNSYNLERAEEYISATLPDLIEFIGGEHSLVPEKIIAVDTICQKLGAPDNLIIELDSNGTLYDNLYQIARSTKFVHFIFSYESSETEYNKRGLKVKELRDFIVQFSKDFKGRVSVRYLFLNDCKTIKDDLEFFKQEGICVKEAYQIYDINNKFAKQSKEDIEALANSDMLNLYYQAFGSIQSELYGYGRSCIDTLVREGWTRKLQGCYLLSVTGKDDREIINDKRIVPSILESHRKLMYEFAISSPAVVMAGGCACTAETMSESESQDLFENNDLFNIARKKKLEEYFNAEPNNKGKFLRQKEIVKKFYSHINLNDEISESPSVLVHFYTGSNLPSLRTIQRYFKMLDLNISSFDLKVQPYCFDNHNYGIWKLNGENCTVDSMSSLDKYNSENVALHLSDTTMQFILIGKSDNIKKEINNNFNNTSPAIYRDLLRRIFNDRIQERK